MTSLLSLSSLLGRSSIDDHEEMLQAANAVLQKSGKDIEAQHVKVVALVKLDRFDDALRTLDHGGDKLKERARLEYAYALYKAGKPAEAAKVAQGHAQARGMRHVEAQASYRNEDFERAATLFKELASGRGNVDNEDMDLRINNSAVNAQLEWSGKGNLVENKKPGREELEAFETAYNAACGSIARDELGQAEVLLRRSKDLCNALEDLSEEEKHAEILPITVQQIYVLLRQGRVEDAQELVSSIDINEITESSTQHVAQTNSTAASSEPTNPYLVHRLIHRAPETIKPDRPFAYQSAAIRRNNYTLDLLSQKYAGIISSTTAAIAKSPSPTLDENTNSLSAFNAAAHARNQAGKEALKAILPVLEKRPSDIGLILVALQLYVQCGNHGAAISLLESFFSRLEQSAKDDDLSARYAPGLIGAMTSLYSARGQTGQARAELGKAAKYWRQKSASSSIPERSLIHLFKTAGTALLHSHNPSDLGLAVEIFTELVQRDPEDRYAAAGLVAAYASMPETTSSITSSHLSTLTPVSRLTAGVDVSALEAAGVAKSATSAVPVSKKRAAAPDTKPAKANKKPRATKMPKTYVEGKAMDPERWLPARDRSTYRPKGKDKKRAKAAAMLTQGGVEDSRPGTPGTPAGELVKGSGGGGGGGGKNKGGKKKKGGKW